MVKICIADDEKYVLESIQYRIRQCGLPVKIVGTAQNGREAYELYEKERPDIFFVDISMPVCGGLEFMERVRRLDGDSTTKFVIISGYDDFAYMKKAIRTGVFNYIMKPVAQEELLETLTELCREIKTEREEKRNRYGWEFLELDQQKEKHCCGTALLVLGDGLIRRMEEKGGLAEKLNRISERFGEPAYFRFHENGNLLLLMIQEYFLNDQEIYEIWEMFHSVLEVWLVYKTGKSMELKECVEEMEATLNARFWEGSMHVLKADPERQEKQPELGKLEEALENTREDEWKRVITAIGTGLFENRANRPALKSMYQSVMILLADQYRRHGYEIPENLREELYAYSLEKCMTRQEVQRKLYEHTGMIHEKIAKETQKKDLVEQVVEYLEHHYMEEINFNDLAGEFFLAPNYLYKKFKEKKQITVMQYLEEIRMKKAGELLENTASSVTEIAMQTGYADSNYFARIFKKNFGVTPREFRKNRKELC